MERYNSLSSFLQKKFGEKVYKVSLFSGLTCPNRDGTKGTDGCIYCNPASSKPFVSGSGPIREQLRLGIEYMRKRHRGSKKFISYFQHYSNTYAKTDDLRAMYEEAVSHPDVVGLAVSTRPDCLKDELWEVLRDLNSRTFLWLELGLQSANDRTLDLNRKRPYGRGFENASKTPGGRA